MEFPCFFSVENFANKHVFILWYSDGNWRCRMQGLFRIRGKKLFEEMCQVMKHHCLSGLKDAMTNHLNGSFPKKQIVRNLKLSEESLCVGTV